MLYNVNLAMILLFYGRLVPNTCCTDNHYTERMDGILTVPLNLEVRFTKCVFGLCLGQGNFLCFHVCVTLNFSGPLFSVFQAPLVISGHFALNILSQHSSKY